MFQTTNQLEIAQKTCSFGIHVQTHLSSAFLTALFFVFRVQVQPALQLHPFQHCHNLVSEFSQSLTMSWPRLVHHEITMKSVIFTNTKNRLSWKANWPVHLWWSYSFDPSAGWCPVMFVGLWPHQGPHLHIIGVSYTIVLKCCVHQLSKGTGNDPWFGESHHQTLSPVEVGWPLVKKCWWIYEFVWNNQGGAPVR